MDTFELERVRFVICYAFVLIVRFVAIIFNIYSKDAFVSDDVKPYIIICISVGSCVCTCVTVLI